MVKKPFISIGVIGIQGAVSEHIAMIQRVFVDADVNGSVSAVSKKEELQKIQGLILPGGESTTISRFLKSHDLIDEIRKRVQEGSLIIMGTCAGCVLLAKKILDTHADVHLLQLMDIEVKRNAFGRQRESFEESVTIDDWKDPFPAVFIRAPAITALGKDCKVLARSQNDIIMVEQDSMLAITFHPELTDDTRIHSYFLSKIQSMNKKKI
jgi:pyridoxal 5'-phosphate synthase pdxT subunit